MGSLHQILPFGLGALCQREGRKIGRARSDGWFQGNGYFPDTTGLIPWPGFKTASKKKTYASGWSSTVTLVLYPHLDRQPCVTWRKHPPSVHGIGRVLDECGQWLTTRPDSACVRVFEELPAWERGTSDSRPLRGQEYVFSDIAPSPSYNQGNSLCSPRKEQVTKASGYVSDQDQRWYAGESYARPGILGTVWPLSGSTESALAAWLLLCSHTSPVPTQPRSEIKRVNTHLRYSTSLWCRTNGWTQIVSSQVRRAGQTQLQSPFSSLEGKGYLSICPTMHISMHIYSGTHTHMHTHINPYICSHNAHMHTHTYACTCVYTHKYTSHRYTYMHIYAYHTCN